MASASDPYFGQLLAEIRKLKRLELITSKLDYQAIQKLKQADRDATLKRTKKSPLRLRGTRGNAGGAFISRQASIPY